MVDVASSSGLLPIVHVVALGLKWLNPRDHLFYMHLYREKTNNLLFQNQKAQAQAKKAQAFDIASSSALLPRLFK